MAVCNSGNLTVLASVNGPQEVRIRDELVDRASLEINVRPLRNSSGPVLCPVRMQSSCADYISTGPREKTIEEMLRSLFEPVIRLDKYPRAQIQINVQTTSAPASNDHSFSLSEKSAIVNSVTCALMDAAIEMDALLLAVALVRNPKDELLYLDPNVDEEANASSLLWFAGRIADGQTETVGVEAVNWQDSDQASSYSCIQSCADHCRGSCLKQSKERAMPSRLCTPL